MRNRPEGVCRILGKAWWFCLLCIGGLIGGFAAIGCDRPPPPSGPRPEPLHVLSSVYAMGAIAREVGGERVNVEWLVESGQPLDNIEVTPERRNKFRTADLVLTRGSVEPWMIEGAADVYRERRILRADGLISSREADPRLYLWLDPQVALELTDEIADRLSTLEPRSEIYFKDNAQNLKSRIIELTDKAVRAIGGREAPFLSLDRGFLPLARRFNLVEVRPPSALSLRDPSPYAVRVLRDTAKSSGAGAIFANAETPPALVRDWQARLGVDVLPLDALGSSAASGRSGYIELLRYNLDQLMTGVSQSKRVATTTTKSTEPATQPIDPNEPIFGPIQIGGPKPQKKYVPRYR